MAKITDYSAVTRFDSDGILLTDGTSGTKKITAVNAAIDLAGKVSDMQHRNIFGGRNLGSTITQAQKTAIQNGTFDNLFVGDYWTIPVTIGGTSKSIQWTIADMDYFYRVGDTDFTKHHLVIVPSSALYNSVMNDTNTTEGGYVGSKMYTEGLDDAKTAFAAAFPDMVLTHKDYLVNAVTDGKASAGAWYESTVELMNEVQVYGTFVRTPMATGTLNTTGKQQFALFQLNPKAVNNRSTYWLRDVVSATFFAVVLGVGGACNGAASTSLGVRPYAVIGV